MAAAKTDVGPAGRKHQKLLLVIRRLDSGGAERQLVLLARELHRRGHVVSVATYYQGGSFQPELEQSGVSVYSLDKFGRWDVLRFGVRLLRCIWHERPAVVYGYLSMTNLLLLLMRPMLRIGGVAVVCGIRASKLESSLYDWLTAFIDICHWRLLRFADTVICNSTSGQELAIASGVSPTKCSVVDNGIDSSRFCFAPEKRVAWRRAFGFCESDIVVGVVGRHDPMKGYESFIAAAAMIASRNARVRFVAVGYETPCYSDGLREQVKVSCLGERWLWAGHADDLASVYSGIDVFCLASRSGEGFPNVIGEAMSCGLPCVVTDVGDSARLVRGSGWVVPPRNPEALADGLTCAIEALPRWDRVPPRQRIEEQFSVNRMIDGTLTALSPWLGRTS